MLSQLGTEGLKSVSTRSQKHATKKLLNVGKIPDPGCDLSSMLKEVGPLCVPLNPPLHIHTCISATYIYILSILRQFEQVTAFAVY